MRLSTRDLTRLAGVQRMLLEPLATAGDTPWRDEVLVACRALLGADKGTLLIPSADGIALHADGHDPVALQQYTQHFMALDTGHDRIVEERLEVSSWRRLHASDGVERTEFYNDFIVPFGLFDAVALHPVPGPQSGPWMAFHNHRPGPTDFGERGEQLLSLILPSLRAALAIQERLGRHRTELLALLDRIEDALVLFDERCYPAHVNRSATAMVAGDPEGDALLRRAAMLARIGRHRPEQRCSVVTAVARYELRAAQVTEQLLGDGRSTVILIDRASPRLPTSDELRRRWKLTAREAEVALLLARGARNAAIASALHISARTARTHTEHVFSKLGVATRAQVGDRLRG